MPRASAADAAATAHRILQTATEHFAAHGYADASVDDIARAAEVTRGAVYHLFTSKPLLFAAVAAQLQTAVAETIETATRHSSPETALRDGSHAFLDAITHGASARVLLVDGPAVLGWEQWRKLDTEGPEQELRTGLREAGIPAALLDPLATALSGAMNELALWLAARPGDAAARRHAHGALDRLLDAIAARG